MLSLTNSYCVLGFVLLLCGALLGQEESSDGQLQPESHDCPTWTYFNSDTQRCQCGRRVHHFASCVADGNTSKVEVLVRFCMTQNKEQTKVVVGPCPYNSKPTLKNDVNLDVYISVPRNITELDKALCGNTNRTGQLCGQCVEGHSPPVYSYYPQCVNCTSGTNNWPKYLAVSLLPTTVFFLGILTLRLRATSPLLNGYILLCQIITAPPIQRLIAYSIYTGHYKNPQEVKMSSFIYFGCIGIWNLDFFRLAYTPFCLHPNASTLQVLSLDYIIAAYPLALIILTYTLVRLHYHNCTLVVWLWRPFISCFARCRRQWDIQNSLVDAFATFLLLSYVKFLSASFDILMPTFSWDMDYRIQPAVLYYDGSIEYFGKDYVHMPYALLAIAVLLVFTFLPILLLCLYPCRCFQRFLNRYHLSSPALHTFMDIFQGSFKDGTNGTRDCRYFAAVYLIARVVLYLSVGISIVTFNTSMVSSVLLFLIVLLALFQPYKESLYNKLNICLVATLMMFFFSAMNFHLYVTWLERSVDTYLLVLVSPIPLLYPLCLLSYHVWKNAERFQTTITRVFFQRPASHQPTDSPLPQLESMSETTALLASN